MIYNWLTHHFRKNNRLGAANALSRRTKTRDDRQLTFQLLEDRSLLSVSPIGLTDLTGPTVAGVYAATAAGVVDTHLITHGERLVSDIAKLVVTFSENLATSGPGSVLDSANWRLEHNGIEITNHISGITFDYNATANRYEAVLSPASPLTSGIYRLTARSSIRDSTGNLLDGGFHGGIIETGYLLEFTISSSTPAGIEFRVNTTTAKNQRTVFVSSNTVAMDANGDFVVTWSSQGQDDNDGFYGVYAQRYNAAGVAQGSEFRVNTTTKDNQICPAVAMDADGDFVVTWISPDSSRYGIYARRYNAAGVPQEGEFLVNTMTGLDQDHPAVAMDADGDFVVTWSSLGDGSENGVYAQRFNSVGVPQGEEFRVNTTTFSGQDCSSVAMDADGDFVVTWSGYGQDDGSGVYAQRYNAAGVPQGGEFRVNTTTTYGQGLSRVAMDADGDFVVTWSSYWQDGDRSYGVYAQRYNAAGLPQGDEFCVNTTTAKHQRYSTVAMDADSDFVVSWSSYGQDGSRYGIYAQRYNAMGMPQGDEFRVNTTTASHQRFSTLAMDGDGDFVVTWSSYDEDGSDEDIHAQLYNSQPAVANLDTDTVAEDNATTINVIANDNAGPTSESPTLTVTAVTQGAHGTVVNNNDGTVTYTPNLNYFGFDSFTYTVANTKLATAVGTVTVTVTSVNDSPRANDDTATVAEDDFITSSVLTNDDGGPSNEDQTLTIIAVTQGAKGTVANNGDGTITYTPIANYFGPDSYTYTVQDSSGATATAIVSVTIVSDSPLAHDDTDTVAEDNSVTTPVLANDNAGPDNEDQPLTITSVTQGAHGTVVNHGDGTITYTPAANYFGPDSYRYTVQDNDGNTDTATVSIDVTPVVDPSSLRVSNPSVDESAGTMTFVVTLNGTVDGPFAVDFATVDQSARAGRDYTATSGQLTFAGSNAEAHTVTISLVDNSAAELDETFQLNLSNVQPTTSTPVSVSTAVGTGTILNDDPLLSGAANVQVTSTMANGVVAGSGKLVYKVTVKNAGPADVANLVLDQWGVLPAGVIAKSIKPSSGAFSGSASSGTWTIPKLKSNKSATLTITLMVGASTVLGADAIELATAAISASRGFVGMTDDTTTRSASVVPQADLSVTKNVPKAVLAGANFAYTVTVKNSGPGTAQSVALTDVLPSNVTIVSQTQKSGPAFALSNTATSISNSIAALASGATATFEIIVSVDANVADKTKIASLATVSTTSHDPKMSNNDDSVTAKVVHNGVTLSPSTTEPGKQDLVIGGTAKSGTISVTPSGSSVQVTINGKQVGTYMPTGQIIAYGRAGNDSINVHSSINLSALLFGEAGNDTLSGGGGHTALVVGDGIDNLVAGDGRNIVIAGSGQNTLNGSSGANVLIAGRTNYDTQQTALTKLLAEWSRSDADYATRLAHLRGTSVGGLNNGFELDATTVHDNAAVDTILSSSDQDDWFLARTEGGVVDSITGKDLSEELVEI